MSRHRSISTSISLDKDINRLAREAGDFAALLYTWMIPHAEDSARITGDLEELLLTVCPGFRTKTEDDVAAALEAMDRIGLVAWDRGADIVYFDSESFYRHQSYIPTAKRADNSEHFRKSPQNAEECRKSPQNAASLSLSPSLNPQERKSSLSDSGESDGANKTEDVRDFDEWWATYGRIGDRSRALDLYRWWVRSGKATPAALLAAAVAYRDHCAATDCKMKHGATFLAKPTKVKSAVWPEWAAGEAHGTMDVSAASHLNDVLTAGAAAFGLNGGDNGHRPGALEHDRPAGALGRGADARRGLPPGELASGL